MMDLTAATTKELTDELARRDGTASLYFGRGEEITVDKWVQDEVANRHIPDNKLWGGIKKKIMLASMVGPARILVVRD